MGATPSVVNGPDTIPGLLRKCVVMLLAPLLGQRVNSAEERLTASQLQDRYVHDPSSLNRGLRRAAEYLLKANGNAADAFRQCSRSKRSGSRSEERTNADACVTLYQLLPSAET